MKNKLRITPHISRFIEEGRILAEYLGVKRRSILFRGILGELLVFRKLLEKGKEVSYYGGQKKNFDIKLIRKKNQEITIDCKEKTGDRWVRLNLNSFWRMPQVKKGQRQIVKNVQPCQPDFYIFIDSKKFLDTGKPDFYVFKSNEFCKLAKCIYFKDRKPRSKNPNSSDFYLTADDIKAYKDNELHKLGV